MSIWCFKIFVTEEQNLRPVLKSCFVVTLRLVADLQSSERTVVRYVWWPRGAEPTPLLTVAVLADRYTLQASTFQMAILLQYNTEDSYTVQQLTDSTQIKTVSAQTSAPSFALLCDRGAGVSDPLSALFSGHFGSSSSDSVKIEAAGESHFLSEEVKPSRVAGL